MLIKHVHINNQTDLKDVRIEDGKFSEIAPDISARDQEQVLDGQNKVLLPPFIDSHIHLDATLTAGQPEWNETGTLFDGIRIWSKRKQSLTIKDVKQRARKTLLHQVGLGIQFVRSHVDTTDPHLTALQALLELKAELKDQIELQLVAFPQEGVLSFPHGKELLDQAIKEGADVVGGIPHYEFNQFYGADSLKYLVSLAEKYGVLVDVHCDEIDDPNSRNLEVLATLAYETGLKQRVTASHTTAMGSYNDAYTYKLFRLLKMAGLNFVANPLVNIHLGGRFDTYPKRRGLTRIKELGQAGINVSFGEDDVQDPWNPLGNGNMLDPLQMGVYAGQLMGYQQLQHSFNYVTYNAAKTLQIQDHYGIEVGKPGNCILLNGTDFYQVLNQHAEVLYNIREGRVLAKTTPAKTEIYWK
ncbi:MAG: cytosine deaminase [Liquorilactobacillus nagelii]|jgi:cytosine deaminase|uniref:Cytosine deaminase n=1 Tax=Liquorilactobacillus nagelii TaxID=82688 RepID=A0A3Q8CCI4_9LACO|nr:cytosine deaminase [Liquorilactobacillus nagelii]AUJ32069.1 cytosine deaminase [Liquorilactobacillus nagelii]KRL41035.1 cytosine deaminase [Liquorilactobacillus nagelii DSM 13675]MCC7615226.1 cytosine deaminase [Liquorilactobacillus nagelii]MCP9314893.1 cytosine deaminase [Liquorilactobacillus nagelii]QYH53979.1 cytosine deaminase [Liquorilactobacillus nagelii DSM 13675]